MLLRNFYRMMSCLVSDKKLYYVNSSGGNGSYSITSHNVNTINLTIGMATVQTNYSGSGGVVFGDGDTPPTIDDYKLAGNVLSTLSGTGSISYINDKNTGCGATAVYTLTNNGSVDVTVREVAMVSPCNCGFIVDRTVLDEPIIIPAGGGGQVTYTVKLNYPA